MNTLVDSLPTSYVRPITYGVTVKTKHYTPSFKGIHNAVRSKAWLVLLDHQLSGEPGLTLHQLSAEIGTSYHSLAVLLNKWTGYRRRKPVGYHTIHRAGYGNIKIYRLLKPGRKWLDRWIQEGELPIERYLSELEQVRLLNIGDINDVYNVRAPITFRDNRASLYSL